VVGMCSKGATSNSIKVLKPLTIIQFIDFFLTEESILSKDDTRNIEKYLIKHPDVNRKLLQAYLDMVLNIDGHAIKFLKEPETYEEMVDLDFKKVLEFVEILIEELAEYFPAAKKIKDGLVGYQERFKEDCLENPFKRPIAPAFIRDFFGTLYFGTLTTQEKVEISHQLDDPNNEPVKRRIYNLILDNRLYIDKLIKKLVKKDGKKGLQKQENQRKFEEHRNKTIKSIANALRDPDLRPNMEKYALKIQKHLPKNKY